jgi:hypothetical protein
MATPLFMRDVSLTLSLVGTGTPAEFNCDAHTAEVIAEAGDDVTYQTLCPDGSFSEIGRSKYSLHIVAAQDWSAAGLARFLWDNEGATADFTYQAHGDATVPSADTPGMAGTVRLVAPNYGGEAEAYAELDVTMPCTAKPTIATAAFPLTAATEAA